MIRSEVAGKDLFLTQESLGPVEKIALTKVDRDPSKWESNLMTLLHEQYPFLQDYDVRIHMNRTDPEVGTAIGQIVVNDKIAIPVVIDALKVQPFDLFWAEGKLRPMTKATLMSFLQDTGVGKSIEPGQGEMADMSIYNVTHAPFSGKYSFAEGLTFSLDEYEKALNRLGREGLEYAMKTNSVFTKVASAYAAGAMEKTGAAKPVDSYDIEKIDFRPFDNVSKPGVYSTVFGGMNKNAAFLFDRVIGWDNEVFEDKKMILSLEKDAEVAVADEIGGRPLDAGAFVNVHLEETPKRGDVGFFWMAKYGHAIATWPVKFLYWGTDPEGLPFMKVADLGANPRERTLHVSPDCQSIAQMGDAVLMSPDWSWRRCGRMTKVASAAEANKMTWPSDSVEIRHREGCYSLHGVSFDGFSKEGEDVAKTYALLVGRTDNPDCVFDLMKQAEDEGSSFCRMIKRSTGINKLAGAYRHNPVAPVNLVDAAVRVRPFAGSFMKIALDVTEPEAANTVDTMLGLNFINEANTAKFLEHVDQLEDASDALAKILMASRLGLKVDQGPIKSGLFAMDGVIRQMTQLRSAAGGTDVE
jgi:hypothetical protein